MFQPSHPLRFRRIPSGNLVAVARHRIAGDDDIAVDLVAPCVPAGLSSAGKELQIWSVRESLNDGELFLRLVGVILLWGKEPVRLGMELDRCASTGGEQASLRRISDKISKK